MPFNRLTDKQTVVQPHDEILLSDKKEMSYKATKKKKNHEGTLNACC